MTPHEDSYGAEEERYRWLVESLSEQGLALLDLAGHVTIWNTGAARLTGFAAVEMLGQSVGRLFAAGESDFPRLLARARAASDETEELYRWRHRDGSLLGVSASLKVVGGGSTRALALSFRRWADVARPTTPKPDPSTDLCKTILDGLSDSVAACDVSGRFVYMNSAALDLAGRPERPADTVEASVAAHGVFLPDGKTPFPLGDSTMMRALRGETCDDVEAVMRNARHPTGTAIRVNTRPLRDAAGTVTGAVVVAHDISAAKRAEAALERQTVLLKSVLDCVVESVAVFDVDGRLLMSNPAFDALMGKRFPNETTMEERFQHYGLFDVSGARRLAPEESPARRAMRGEVVRDIELFVRSPAYPEGVVVSTNAQRLFDDHGVVVGAVVTGRDVTARRAADQRLLEQKNLLASILECLGEAVVVYDPVGRILLANPAAERLMERNTSRSSSFEARTREMGFFSIQDGRQLEASESAGGKALRGESADDIEVLVRTPTRPEGIILSSNVRPLRGGDDALVGAVITTRNVTARYQAERELERLVRELQRSNDELAQFAYVASHDLRAPLRAIGNLARWLEKDLSAYLTPDSAELMKLLLSRTRRMDQLLSDLLEYSRLDNSASTVESIDLAVLVAEVVDLAAAPAGFQVVCDVPPLAVETAPLPLRRALLNLVSNAIKHHDRPVGLVRVAVEERGEVIDFVVTDDGPGIAPQFHRRIFEMFQTLRSRDDAETSGMGLALVKKIVDRAGGKVTVESEGRGATFRLTWPRRWLGDPSLPPRSAAT